VAEARSLLADVLAAIRGGLKITSDFKLRVLVAIAIIESQDSEHERALAYLEEARGLTTELDDLRRARYLFNLAVEYQETGDYEGSLRAASQSAALFRAAESDRELAALENTSALTYLQMGNPRRATEALRRAIELVGSQTDDRFAAHLAETEARIHLAQDEYAEAGVAIGRAIKLAGDAANHRTLASAYLTRAHLAQRLADEEGALASFEAAAGAARQHGGRGILRRVLAEWAEMLTGLGRLEESTRLYQEALREG
jgi:tetratricopeptide (TPR) repeat protein